MEYVGCILAQTRRYWATQTQAHTPCTHARAHAPMHARMHTHECVKVQRGGADPCKCRRRPRAQFCTVSPRRRQASSPASPPVARTFEVPPRGRHEAGRHPPHERRWGVVRTGLRPEATLGGPLCGRGVTQSHTAALSLPPRPPAPVAHNPSHLRASRHWPDAPPISPSPTRVWLRTPLSPASKEAKGAKPNMRGVLRF